MYRLMIVDDEDDERIGIKFLIKKFGFDFEIIEAANGIEALELLKENPVDILFTDVKMPFLNGLELSSRAKEDDPEIQIIFFSGFDDFEYVKQALSLQAVDYILKPVNPAEFQRTIQKVIDRMEQHAAEYEQSRQERKNYILTRLFNKIPLDKLKYDYGEEELAFLDEYTRLILLEFEEEFFGNKMSETGELCQEIKVLADVSFDLIDLNPSQGILLLKEPRCAEKECREFALGIHSFLEEKYGTRCFLAISTVLQNVCDMEKVYVGTEQILEERFFHKGSYVYPIDERKEEISTDSEKEGQLLMEIEKDVKCRDFYSLDRNVELMLDKCKNNGFQSYIYTRFVCANLLKVLYQGLADEEGTLIFDVEKLYACGRFEDIEAIIQGIMGKLEQVFLAGSPANRTIAIVEQYILKHYMDELSLDILADKVYLTSHYLSSMFNREKGIGINRYIKNVRMEKARELLLDTNMKINDICKAVGYSNLSYFCKAFRNEHGMTPEKYREHQG